MSIATSAIRMGGATIAFALLHSMLASRGAKKAAARAFGQKACDAGYRAFYTGQATVSFLLLALYGARLPSRTLYRARGVPALLLRCGQLAGALHLYAAASQAGIGRLAGVHNLQAWRNGEETFPPPAAQGPELDWRGQLASGGPYAWSRHPLNWSGIPIFWLTPHMTVKRLAFNLVSTAYFIAGSKHEAVRLRQAYGTIYREYEESGVRFFWPSINGVLTTCRTRPGLNASGRT